KLRTEICIKKFVKDIKNNNFPNVKNMYQIS
ncbi:MAG: 3-methyl-2-oxobutanoate hydroxymethyltransferase, partial [Proteobacteria bacterium]|nr:3-methyl-2-oxobutanoate hydroxymethyltransferase [Candidatus Fonsibacter lacus]